MAASTNKTTLRIGIIAEEKNDVEVLYEITAKIIPENSFTFKQFVGHGCGKLRKKCAAWAENLVQKGCTRIVVVHDLDRHDEPELRQKLEAAIDGLDCERSLVLIPIEELEAWLLTDKHAIRDVFKMRRLPKIPRNTERIKDPKEFLESIVKRNSKTNYLNTVHNRRIANALALDEVKRCKSFAQYPEFVT